MAKKKSSKKKASAASKSSVTSAPTTATATALQETVSSSTAVTEKTADTETMTDTGTVSVSDTVTAVMTDTVMTDTVMTDTVMTDKVADIVTESKTSSPSTNANSNTDISITENLPTQSNTSTGESVSSVQGNETPTECESIENRSHTDSVSTENLPSIQETEQKSSVPDDTSSDSDSDDEAPIVPYLLKKQTADVDNANISEKQSDASSSPTTRTSLNKKKPDFPPKVQIEEDHYNEEDRGVRSSVMYLQNIRKQDEDEKERSTRVFRPAVAKRLAHVKTDLELRVIAVRKAREDHEQKVEARRKSCASIEWTFRRREREEEERAAAKLIEDLEATLVKEQEEVEEQIAMLQVESELPEDTEVLQVESELPEDTEVSTATVLQAWVPASISLKDSDDSDSDNDDDEVGNNCSDSDSDDEMIIVPRKYGDDTTATTCP